MEVCLHYMLDYVAISSPTVKDYYITGQKSALLYIHATIINQTAYSCFWIVNGPAAL